MVPVMGWKIVIAGLLVGLAAMAFSGANYSAARAVGVTAWAIAIFVGLPWVLVETAKKRGR